MMDEKESQDRAQVNFITVLKLLTKTVENLNFHFAADSARRVEEYAVNLQQEGGITISDMLETELEEIADNIFQIVEDAYNSGYQAGVRSRDCNVKAAHTRKLPRQK